MAHSSNAIVLASGARVWITLVGRRPPRWSALRDDGTPVCSGTTYGEVRDYLAKYGGAIDPSPAGTPKVF